MFKNGFIVFLFISIAFAPETYSKDCDRYKTKISYLEDLRRHGGKTLKMIRWQNQSRVLDEKFIRCKNGDSNTPSIQVITGAKAATKSKRLQYQQKKLESSVQNLVMPSSANVKKLRECIKPNNLIDNQVNECLKGKLEPSWYK
jgi:hypothetical protein